MRGSVPYTLKSVKYMQYKPSLGDVVVVGMVQDRHVIADISFNVPYGIDTTIPGALAAQSKDLWRDIGQRKLFKKPSAVMPAPHPVSHKAPPQNNKQLEALSKQVAELQRENKELVASIRAKESSESRLEMKLEALLDAVKNGITMAPGTVTPGVAAPVAKAVPLVDGSAPTFLPSQIKMEDVEARIDVQGESSDSNVSDAAAKLRALRKKKG